MPRPLLTPFATTYSLTTDRRQQRGAAPIQMRTGRTKRDAMKHAQRAANAMQVSVWIIEHDQGMSDYYTQVRPE